MVAVQEFFRAVREALECDEVAQAHERRRLRADVPAGDFEVSGDGHEENQRTAGAGGVRCVFDGVSPVDESGGCAAVGAGRFQKRSLRHPGVPGHAIRGVRPNGFLQFVKSHGPLVHESLVV
jgi:hypothetical protein